MVNPGDVIDVIIEKIKNMDGYSDLGLDDVIQITEKPSKSVQPPYIGIYFDYKKTADSRTSRDQLRSIPVNIHVLLFSSGYSEAVEAFREVFSISEQVKDVVHDQFHVNGKNITLKWDDLPLQILQMTANQSVIRLNLYYQESIEVV